MRKMPHGQYVPFEGYDQIHNCRGKAEKGSAGGADLAASEAKNSMPVSSPSVHRERTSQSLENTPAPATVKSTGIPAWVWWVGILALILLWLILRK